MAPAVVSMFLQILVKSCKILYITFTIVCLGGEVCGVEGLHSNFTPAVNFVQFSSCSEL